MTLRSRLTHTVHWTRFVRIHRVTELLLGYFYLKRLCAVFFVCESCQYSIFDIFRSFEITIPTMGKCYFVSPDQIPFYALVIETESFQLFCSTTPLDFHPHNSDEKPHILIECIALSHFTIYSKIQISHRLSIVARTQTIDCPNARCQLVMHSEVYKCLMPTPNPSFVASEIRNPIDSNYSVRPA